MINSGTRCVGKLCVGPGLVPTPFQFLCKRLYPVVALSGKMPRPSPLAVALVLVLALALRPHGSGTVFAEEEDLVDSSGTDSVTDAAETAPVEAMEDELFEVEDPRAGRDGLTRVRCQLFGAWGDFCEYRNLCFESLTKLTFVVPDDSPRLQKKVTPTRAGIRFTTKLPLRDPKPQRITPTHFLSSATFVGQSQMKTCVRSRSPAPGVPPRD